MTVRVWFSRSSCPVWRAVHTAATGIILLAVSLLEYNEEDEHDLESMVREQMTEWFKEQAEQVALLKGLSDQERPAYSNP